METQMTKLKYIISMLLIAAYATATIIQKPICTPKNTVIATDIDGVLCENNIGKQIKQILKHFGGIVKYRKINKKRNKQASSRGHKCGEAIYIDCIAQGDHKTARAIRTITTKQKRLKKDTVQLYQKLHARGFNIYCATNIGSIFFQDLQQKFSAIFNNHFIKHGITVDYANSDIILKPDPRYFEKLKIKLNPNGDKHIIFIDDTLQNITAARKAGLIAIHFQNITQLQRELTAYNITV